MGEMKGERRETMSPNAGEGPNTQEKWRRRNGESFGPRQQ